MSLKATKRFISGCTRHSPHCSELAEHRSQARSADEAEAASKQLVNNV